MTKKLPESEYRRSYFLEMKKEIQLLFNVTPKEAQRMAEQTVIYLQAKFLHEDEISFGLGTIKPRKKKPRVYSLICGKGSKKEERQEVMVGERTIWKVNFYKRFFEEKEKLP